MSKTISIHKQEFEVTTPYAEGHAVTEAEAKALNQCRSENIANNFRKRVKEALEAEDAAGEMLALAKAFKTYDAEYIFTLAATGGSRSTMTPVEKEARKVARDYLSMAIKKEGKTVKGYRDEHGADYVASKILELAEHPQIIDAAKKNLKEAAKLADAQVDLTI